MEKISFSTVIERASGWTNQVQIKAADLAEAEGTNLELVIGEGLKAGDLIRDAAYYVKVPFAGPPPPEPPPEPEAEEEVRDQRSEFSRQCAEGEPEPGPFGGHVVRQAHEPQPDTGLPQPRGEEEGAEPREVAPPVATSVILDVGHRESKDQTQEDTSLLQGYELAAGAEALTIAGNANGEQFKHPPAGYAVKESAEIFATFTSSGGDLKSLTDGEVWIYLNVTRLPGVY